MKSNKKIEVWGHRGASAYAPENTLEAFKLAVEQEADGIELDVQLTKDGKIVVIHDESIQRVSNGYGYVRNFTLEQLKNLRFNKTHPEYSEATIPTLKEVLQLLQDTNLTLNMELKTGIYSYEGIEAQVIDLVKRYGMQNRVWYSSFNHYSIKRVKELCPDARTGVLYSCGIYEPVAYAQNLGAEALHPAIYNLRYKDLIQNCKDINMPIHTWSANSYMDLAYCIKLGVDSVITNYPDRGKVFAALNGDGKYPFENPFEQNPNRQFILFGVGYQGQHFLKRYANKYTPTKLLDNSQAKWGSRVEGILVEKPDNIPQDACIVVAGNYFVEIIKQLQHLGMSNYYVYDEQSDWE